MFTFSWLIITWKKENKCYKVIIFSATRVHSTGSARHGHRVPGQVWNGQNRRVRHRHSPATRACRWNCKNIELRKDSSWWTSNVIKHRNCEKGNILSDTFRISRSNVWVWMRRIDLDWRGHKSCLKFKIWYRVRWIIENISGLCAVHVPHTRAGIPDLEGVREIQQVPPTSQGKIALNELLHLQTERK